MTDLETIFAQSEIALAAYAKNLFRGISEIDYQDALIDGGNGLSPAQAATFSHNWTILDQYNDNSTGLSATVFADASGKKYLAIRGTEPNALDLTADGLLALGLPASLNPQFVSLKAQIERWRQDSAVLGSDSFTVTGHSLGGYLAAAVKAQYDSQVAAAYLYNAPGVSGPVGNLFALFGLSGTPTANVWNITASEGASIISGLGAPVGTPVSVQIEAAPGAGFGNHDIAPLTDALAVQALYSKLDPNLTSAQLNALVDSSGSPMNNTVEAALDALRKLLFGPTVASTATDKRNDFYTNLYELQKSAAYTTLAASGNAQISVHSTLTADQIKGLASANTSQGLSVRYALQALNPFALVGIDYSPRNANGELSLYNADTAPNGMTPEYLADRSSFLARKLWFSTQDKNPVNPTLVASPDQSQYENDVTYFKDYASGYLIAQGIPSDAPQNSIHRYLFGDENANTLEGAGVEDSLYGGAGDDLLNGRWGADYLEGNAGADVLNGGEGNDTLHGGADNDILLGGSGDDSLFGEGGNDTLYSQGGNDTLDGGAGDDTYVIGVSDGPQNITIVDSDHTGRLIVYDGNGVALNTRLFSRTDTSTNLWKTDDGKVTISHNSPWKLTLSDGSVIELGEGFDPTGFGMKLTDTQAPTTALLGDFNKRTSSDGQQYVVGTDGNYMASGVQADTPDVINGSSLGDSIAGGGGNDGLSGKDGADKIDGGAGSDLILGGFGADTLNGGDGDDFIFGSGVGGIDRPTNVNFTPPAASGVELARGFSWVAYKTSSPDAAGNNVIQIVGANVFPATPAPGGGSLVENTGNVIDGGLGNDYIIAGTGADVVHGGNDQDTIVGMDGADVLDGDAGDDKIWGDGPQGLYASYTPFEQHGNDILSGGDGNDQLVGQGGDDVLFGGNDNDNLFGDDDKLVNTPPEIHGGDYLDGGNGDDQLIGGGNNDQLLGGQGDDKLWGDDGGGQGALPGEYHGADYLNGEDGNDELIGGGQNDSLSGGSGNDSLWGDIWEDDTPLLGGEFHGNDNLNGEDGDDYLEGNGRNDTLLGGTGNDTLIGDSGGSLDSQFEGHDYLAGEDGDDVLGGNGGNDSLFGGNGADALYGDAGDDWLVGDAGDDQLWGDDGNDTLAGGAGSNYMDGGAGDDTYVFNAEDLAAEVTIEDYDGVNTAQFNGIDPIDLTLTADGSTLLLSSGVTQLVVTNGLTGAVQKFQFDDEPERTYVELVGQYSNAPFTTTNDVGQLIVLGGQLSDVLELSNPSALISGGRGDDQITISNVASMLYSIGDGHDVVNFSSSSSTQAIDQIRFGNGISAANIQLLYDDHGSMTLQVGTNGTDSIRFIDFEEASISTPAIGSFAFADGSILSLDDLKLRGAIHTGTSQSEFQGGTAFKDIFLISAGDDTMYGGAGGPDEYSWGRGSGNDVILDNELGGANEQTLLASTGLTANDVMLGRLGNDLLVRTLDGSNRVRVVGQFEQQNGNRTGRGVERMVFDDGTAWNLSDIQAHLTSALTEVGDIYTGTNGNDIVSSLGGADDLAGGLGADDLRGGAGDDWLYGDLPGDPTTGGDDSLTGGTGNDHLSGGIGSDTYIFGLGDGHDVIVDAGDNMNFDTLQLKGFSPTDLAFERRHDGSLLIRSLVSDDSISIPEMYSPDSFGLIERIQIFSDSTTSTPSRTLFLTDILDLPIVIEGTDGIDVMSGELNKNDFLSGGSGEDIYLLGLQQGQDRVIDHASNIILLTGDLWLSDLDAERAGNDMLLRIRGSKDSLRLDGYFDEDSTWSVQDTNNQISDVADIYTSTLERSGDLRQRMLDEYQGEVRAAGDLYVRQHNIRARLVGRGQWESDFYGDRIGAIYDINRTTETTVINYANGNITNVTSTTDSNTWRWPYGAPAHSTFNYSVASIQINSDSASIREGSSHGITNTWTSTPQWLRMIYQFNGQYLTQGSPTYTYGTITDAAGNFQGTFSTTKINSTGFEEWTAKGAPLQDGDVPYESPVTQRTPLFVQSIWSNNKVVNAVYTIVAGDSANTINGGNIIYAGGGDDDAWGDLIYAGDGNDTVYGHLVMGEAGSDAIRGTEDDDWLDGGTGIDTLVGDLGNDSYWVDNEFDIVVELGNAGIDTIFASTNYSLPSNVENIKIVGIGNLNATGNTTRNILTGNSGNNILNGGSEADTLIGGLGNDTYVVDNAADIVTEVAGEGTDTVKASISWTLGAELENLTLTGSAAITGTGNVLANALVGNSANNTLTGGGGNDTLNGGAGADTMVGGLGNDTYMVDNVADVITEVTGEGTDTVSTTISWTLGAELENLTLTGLAAINGTGNALANSLSGNSASNTLTGGDGNDTLNGGAGADTLVGGAGNDTYVVDNAADVVTELAVEGIDTIQSAVNWSLLGSNVENLSLTGSVATEATGNALNNALNGNSANNLLTGGDGNDTLNGGAGTDTLVGGLGDDVYVVNVASDVVTEAASAGTDTVQSAVTWTLGDTLENLTLTGSAAINGTGNALDNVLIGNYANNVLSGGAGNDTLIGGSSADTLIGGTGNDTYIVDTSYDTITERANEGIDTVQSGVTWTLGNNVENLLLTGSAAVNGTGNSLDNVLTGNAGANVLSGAAGNDTYIGGLGADTLTDTSMTSNEVYVWGRDAGADTVSDAGGVDRLDILPGATEDQIWLRQVGNNLELSVIGTSDSFTVNGWYSNSVNRIESFRLSDGQALQASQVQQLVDAMAAFAPPAAGQTTLPANYASALNPVIAPSWA